MTPSMRRPGLLALCIPALVIAACSGGTRAAAGPDARPDPVATPDVRPVRGPAPYTQADVDFIAGMISHHAQAVLVAGWAPSHDASPSVRALCERIVVAQRDEIAFMQRWLRERNQPVPEADPRGHRMPGMDHMVLMPGMLTAEQLAQLDRARGAEFDRLFLRFMIQHHEGALTMVDRLLGAPGAAQDGPVFRFAADVHADQSTEINRMTLMLEAMDRSPQ
jgi:uncharacterized protein (DUF305 family)